MEARRRLDNDPALINLHRKNEVPASPIEACDNALEFVTKHDFRADETGKKLDFERYSYSVEPLSDPHRSQCYMAGAQVSKTLMMMSQSIRFAVLRWGAQFGYYLPDDSTATYVSDHKFEPLVRLSPGVSPYLGKAVGDKKGLDGAHARNIGLSSFFFLSSGSKSGTESRSFDGVFLDEIRKMGADEINRILKRQSGVDDPILFACSTAFWPDGDIHKMFMEGTQNWFHSDCGCRDGVVLSKVFPECIEDLKGATPERLRHVRHAFAMAGLPFCGVSEEKLKEYGMGCFVCPKCGEIITDPRQGWWEPDNEKAFMRSWQISQMLSPTYSGPRCAQEFYRPIVPLDLQEAYNSMAGVPYLDYESLPVQLEHLEASVNDNLVWAGNQTQKWRRENLNNVGMGVDHMGGYICIVVKRLTSSQKHTTIHLEVIPGDPEKDQNAWARLCQVMIDYDVRYCLIEGLPNYDNALQFAVRFKSRVYIVTYSHAHGAPIANWHDRIKKPKGQKDRETGYKYTVTIHQAKTMQWSLARWRNHQNETPHPDKLIQQLPMQGGKVVLSSSLRKGNPQPVAICRTVYWEHLTHTGFEKIPEAHSEVRHSKRVRGVSGLDPHFSMANMMADLALSRMSGSI